MTMEKTRVYFCPTNTKINERNKLLRQKKALEIEMKRLKQDMKAKEKSNDDR